MHIYRHKGDKSAPLALCIQDTAKTSSRLPCLVLSFSALPTEPVTPTTI